MRTDQDLANDLISEYGFSAEETWNLIYRALDKIPAHMITDLGYTAEGERCIRAFFTALTHFMKEN